MKQKPFNEYYFVFINGQFKKSYAKDNADKNKIIKTYTYLYPREKVTVK
tara:strand:- start:69 stop:215 length:147 start_codon:yes stop_codon:yes gene_type:complete